MDDAGVRAPKTSAGACVGALERIPQSSPVAGLPAPPICVREHFPGLHGRSDRMCLSAGSQQLRGTAGFPAHVCQKRRGRRCCCRCNIRAYMPAFWTERARCSGVSAQPPMPSPVAAAADAAAERILSRPGQRRHERNWQLRSG